MGTIATKLCDKMLGEFDSRLAKLASGHAAMAPAVSSAVTVMQDTTYTDKTTVENATQSAQNQMSDMVPSFDSSDALDEMKSMFEGCPTFAIISLGDIDLNFPKIKLPNISLNLPDINLPGISFGDIFDGPADAISGLFDRMNIGAITDFAESLQDGASDLLNSIYSGMPELGIANALNDLLDSVSVFNFMDLIPKMDGLLNCLSSICGRDVQSRMDNMNSLVSDLYLNDDGSMNLGSMMDSAGLDADKIASLTGVTDTVTTVKANITTSINDGISFAKSKASGGFHLI